MDSIIFERERYREEGVDVEEEGEGEEREATDSFSSTQTRGEPLSYNTVETNNMAEI